MNRDLIKYIAMFTMLLNHIGNVLLEPGTVLQSVFLNIGYFTAPTMCYFLAEGFHYTKSRIKYGVRLLVFALLSQVPFSMALFGVLFQTKYLNMLFTLFFCFLILVVKESVKEPFWQAILYMLLIGATSSCDWPVTAAAYTLMFAYNIGNRKNMLFSYGVAVGIFALMMFQPHISIWEMLGGCAAVAASGVVILFCYNGKRAEYGRNFHKWFFYLFYPAHLLVLGIVANL